MLSAKQAAEATGVSKQAILRAIKRGTVSASKDIHGEWTIDAAELFRHYQPLSVVHTNGDASDAAVHTPDTPSVDALREKVVMLERIINTKDDMIASKDDTIADLRSRLDSEAEERRKLAMILTDVQHQRAPEVQPAATTAPTERPRSWWARVLGR